MKGLLLLFLISFCLTACPNLCSGHGTCSRSGSCICYPGWTEGDCSARTCPYDNPYVQPEIGAGDLGDERSFLECSGQGECDRTSGLCQCYPGYEGTACQRQSCPNGCSNHGVCTPVKFLNINEKSQVSMNYEFMEEWRDTTTTDPVKYSYNHWDKEQSFACLCDSEYEGYDCSQKKCPTGYFPTSDCDAPAQYTETIEFKPTTVSNSMAYLEYKDQLGRTWYSQHFSTTRQSKDYYCYSDGKIRAPDNTVLGWSEALQTFAVGVIDAQVKCTGDKTTGKYSVLLTFGPQQTGRQEEIRIITNSILGDEFKVASASLSGYHGMRSEDLELCRLKVDDTNNTEIDTCETYKNSGYKTSEPTATTCTLENGIDYCPAYSTLTLNGNIDYTYTDSLPPLPCSNNGICDTSTGLCTCFTGFYGLACTEQSALV